jgi:hypothetical protein
MIVGYEITIDIDQGDAWLNAVDGKTQIFIAHTACAWNHDDLSPLSDVINLRKISEDDARLHDIRCEYPECLHLLIERQPFAFEQKDR